MYRAERELLAATDLRNLAEVALSLAVSRECILAVFCSGESKGRAWFLDSEIHEGEVEIGEGILGRTLSRGVTQSLVGQDFQTQTLNQLVSIHQHVNDAVVIPLRNDAEIVVPICMANFRRLCPGPHHQSPSSNFGRSNLWGCCPLEQWNTNR